MTPRTTVPARRTARRRGRPTGGTVIVDRAQLLVAAEAAIRELGPDVTMEDIATAATVTKPILYRTIGDKAALTTALAELLIDRIDAAVVHAPGVEPSARARFESSVRAYLATVDVDRNLFLFVNGGNRDTEVIRQLIERSAAQLIEHFAVAQQQGHGDPSAARTWGYAIVGALQVVTLMWLRDDYCDLDAVTDHLTRLLWSGVAHTTD